MSRLMTFAVLIALTVFGVREGVPAIQRALADTQTATSVRADVANADEVLSLYVTEHEAVSRRVVVTGSAALGEYVLKASPGDTLVVTLKPGGYCVAGSATVGSQTGSVLYLDSMTRQSSAQPTGFCLG